MLTVIWLLCAPLPFTMARAAAMSYQVGRQACRHVTPESLLFSSPRRRLPPPAAPLHFRYFYALFAVITATRVYFHRHLMPPFFRSPPFFTLSLRLSHAFTKHLRHHARPITSA